MDWRDQGILLAARRHGETSAIIDVLTVEHGRHAGLVRGGSSAKLAPVLQPGAQLDLEWRARLDQHLGTYRVEPMRARAGFLMADRGRLAAFNAMAALALALLPEREPNPGLYTLSFDLTEALAGGGGAEDRADETGWQALYATWELGLLASIGFPLDLSACAATGTREELTWVSPKSGRAVSKAGGAGWEDRLLPLPAFFKGGAPTPEAVRQALSLTGHFLTHWVLPATGLTQLPEARARLLARL